MAKKNAALVEAILAILKDAHGRKRGQEAYVTGFQIFEKLPEDLRKSLGKIGPDIGNPQGAGSRIWKVISRHPDVKNIWLWTKGIKVGDVKHTNDICRAYLYKPNGTPTT